MNERILSRSGVKTETILFCLLIAFATLSDSGFTFNGLMENSSASYQATLAHDGELDLPWHKGIKDVVFIFALGATAFRSFSRRRRPSVVSPYRQSLAVLMVVVTFSFAVGIISLGTIPALLGLRTLSPILAFLIGAHFADKDVKVVGAVVSLLVAIESVVAIAQMAIGFGALNAGWGYRVTGTFFGPNTLAAFGIVAAVWSTLFQRRKLRLTVQLSSVFLIVASGSRGGMLAIAALGLLTLYRRIYTPIGKTIFLVALGPAIVGAIVGAGEISTRGALTDNLAIENDTRLGILLHVIHIASPFEVIFGQGLGAGTNLTYTFASYLPGMDSTKVLIADSTFASLMMQGGAVLFCAFSVFAISPLVALRFQRRNCRPPAFASIALPIVVFVFGMGTIATEVSPFNYLVFALYGYLSRRNISHRGRSENIQYVSNHACRDFHPRQLNN